MFEKYNFAPDYQDSLLACIVAHPEAFMPCCGIFNTNYFTGVERIATAMALFNYWRKNSKYPGWEVLSQVVFDSITHCAEEKEEDRILEYVKRLRKMDTSDYKAVAERVIDWARTRAAYWVLEDQTIKFNEGKFDLAKAITDFEEALLVGFSVEGLKSAAEIGATETNPENVLLGNRWLCKGGGALLVACTGSGKSVATNQAACLWACGREAFGIKPARPLYVLIVQAEDDEDDLREMVTGTLSQLSDEEFALVNKNTCYATVTNKTGDEFLSWLNAIAYQMRPDLIIVNPLNSYIGGKGVQDAKTVTDFLRTGINSVTARHKCGCILVHHTTKTVSQERQQAQKWRPSDWAYAYAGVNEIANWARAMLAIEATHSPTLFKFIAAKRGDRIGWRDKHGHNELVRYFKHADNGTLYWEEATESDIEQERILAAEASSRSKAGRKPKCSDEMLLDALNGSGMTQKEWLEAVNDEVQLISQPRMSSRIQTLAVQGKIFKDKDGCWQRAKSIMNKCGENSDKTCAK